jgi:GNAT superfamily N-acetyltransferase
MTAFATAWALMKMPIVPNSARDMRRQGEDGVFTALFEDPKSGEQLPMRAEYKESDYDPQRDELYAQIGEGENRATSDPNVGAGSPARSYVGFKTAWGDEEEIEALEDSLSAGEDLPMMARQLTTKKPYQRRGYATALYELAALAAKNKNRRIVPSFDQTNYGKLFWGEKKTWPVRDDL